jgi:hypothetical protein
VPHFQAVLIKLAYVLRNDDGSYTFNLESEQQGISTRFNYVEANDTLEGETTLKDSRSALVYRWIAFRRGSDQGIAAKEKK